MTSLLEMWMFSAEFLESKSVEQVIAISGNGKLLDGSETSIEFRQLLANIPSGKLVNYVNECLEHTFDQGGLALQDVVNEIGRRLGFQVEHGFYRGGKTKIGFDGIWRSEDGYSLVIEVKTTSAYQIDLDIQANYRDRLADEARISKDKSSILIVVGRNDTGGLEAQTRGSRHAWDIRIISVDALIRLLGIKEEVSESKTVQKIHEILKPLEYTRVDRLIDFIFTTTEDIKSEEIEEEDTKEISLESSDVVIPAKFHEECMSLVSRSLSIPLIKQGKSKYSSSNLDTRVLCIVSKEYHRSGTLRYWYAFHPNQMEYLENGMQAYVALGCGDASIVFLIPIKDFVGFLPRMRRTESKGRMYWHVEIFKDGNTHRLLSPGKEGVDIGKYRIEK